MKAAQLVWLAAALYALAYTLLGWDRYVTYHSGSDLGLFTQSFASAKQGFANTIEGGSHFRVHFSPILYLCVPFVLAARSALALVALQAVAGALVAPPLFALARRWVPDRLALGIALVALLYPPLAGVTFADFHENGFAPALTLWLLWALVARRFSVAALFVTLTLGIKEDQATIVGFAALCACAWYAKRRDAAGAFFSLAALAASIAAFVGFFEVVRPLAGARDVWGPTHFYTWSRIVDPRGSAPWWSIGRPAYFLEALVPLCFAALGSPAFVLALPGFAEVLASHESITYTMGQHYAAIWIPYVLFAYALAIARMHAHSPRIAHGFVRASLVVSALVLALASPTHWGHYLRLRNANDAALDRVLARLPPGAAVAAPDEIFAHLGFYPAASLGLPRKLGASGDPKLAIVDTLHADSALGRAMRAQLRTRDGMSAYRLIEREDGIELYVARRAEHGGASATRAEAAQDGRRSGASGSGARARQVVARRRRNE